MVVLILDRNNQSKTDSVHKKQKIGIFDSGLGGISVLSAIKKVLPNESYLYIGDSAHAPYGVKTKEEVFELSKNICDEMIESGVKAIVIACNTATSAAVTRLRDLYDISIIGMEPAVKPALEQVKGKIHVFATEMTLKEEKFQRLIDQLGDGHRIVKVPAPIWVDCVENHLADESYVRRCVYDYLEEHAPKSEGIVLGCTHFIFLKNYILEYYQNQIEIFDGNMGTAIQLKNTLNSSHLSNDSKEIGTIEIRNTKSEEYVQKSKELLAILEEVSIES